MTARFLSSAMNGKRKRSGESSDSSTANDGDDGDSVFSVECILNSRETASGRQFLVKWRNYPSDWNTWEPEENLQDCAEVLQDYWEKVKSGIFSISALNELEQLPMPDVLASALMDLDDADQRKSVCLELLKRVTLIEFARDRIKILKSLSKFLDIQVCKANTVKQSQGNQFPIDHFMANPNTVFNYYFQ